jgi:transposase-like protein
MRRNDEQKIEALRLLDSGLSLRKAAERIGVHHSTLYRWGLRRYGNPVSDELLREPVHEFSQTNPQQGEVMLRGYLKAEGIEARRVDVRRVGEKEGIFREGCPWIVAH